MYVRVCICVPVPVYVYSHVYIYIYIHVHVCILYLKLPQPGFCRFLILKRPSPRISMGPAGFWVVEDKRGASTAMP